MPIEPNSVDSSDFGAADTPLVERAERAADYAIHRLHQLSRTLGEMSEFASPDEVASGFDARADYDRPDDPRYVQAIRLKIQLRQDFRAPMKLLCDCARKWHMPDIAMQLADFGASPRLHAKTVDDIRNAVLAVKVEALSRSSLPSENLPEQLKEVREIKALFEKWAATRTHWELHDEDGRKGFDTDGMNGMLIKFREQAKPLIGWAESYGVDAGALGTICHDQDGGENTTRRADVRAVLSKLEGAILAEMRRQNAPQSKEPAPAMTAQSTSLPIPSPRFTIIPSEIATLQRHAKAIGDYEGRRAEEEKRLWQTVDALPALTEWYRSQAIPETHDNVKVNLALSDFDARNKPKLDPWDTPAKILETIEVKIGARGKELRSYAGLPPADKSALYEGIHQRVRQFHPLARSVLLDFPLQINAASGISHIEDWCRWVMSSLPARNTEKPTENAKPLDAERPAPQERPDYENAITIGAFIDVLDSHMRWLDACAVHGMDRPDARSKHHVLYAREAAKRFGITPTSIGNEYLTVGQELKFFEVLRDMAMNAAHTAPNANAEPAVDKPTVGVASSGMTWRAAKKAAEDHCARNPFPGLNALAKLAGCSASTMSKAIDRSASLRAKLAEHKDKRRSVAAVAMNEGVAASAKQVREPDPIDAASHSTDDLFHRLLEQATPAEREKLNAMPPDKRRELVATVENDPDGGRRVRGRKR